jgi:hypothetical protein
MFPVDEMTTEQFWVRLSQEKDSGGQRKFGSICDLVFAALSLPISNAAVERLFSLMNVVKTKLRNRLHVTTAAAILRVRYGLLLRGQNCSTFIPSSDMLKRFNSQMYAVANQRDNQVNQDDEIDRITEDIAAML